MQKRKINPYIMAAQWNRIYGTPYHNSEALSFWGNPFVLVLPSDVLQSRHPTAPVKVFYCNSSCRVVVDFWFFTGPRRHNLHAMHWLLPSTSPYTLHSMFLERFWKKEGRCSFFSSPHWRVTHSVMHHGHLSKLQVGGEIVRRIAWLGILFFSLLAAQADGRIKITT
jgi:hypothetical protein